MGAAARAALAGRCPHALPLAERVATLRAALAAEAHSAAGLPAARLHVRRSLVAEDCASSLGSGDGLSLLRPGRRLFVQFVGPAGPEAGVDGGGLTRELFSLLGDALFDPRRGLWAAAQPSGCLHPTPAAGATDDGRALLRLAGALAGRCLADGSPLGRARLAPFFVAAALGAPSALSLDDVRELDPGLHRSLAALKRTPAEGVDALGLTFVAEADDGQGGTARVELQPGGAALPVTGATARAYVASVADWRLRGAVAPAAAAFRAGLSAALPPALLAPFSPHELAVLLCGADDAPWSVDDLARHAQLAGGYTPACRPVLLLWALLRGYNADQRRAFLRFATGSDRPPLGGFAAMEPPFTVSRVADDGGGAAPRAGLLALLRGTPPPQRLPSASTCFHLLKLPPYRSAAALRDKMTTAIEGAGGFELS